MKKGMILLFLFITALTVKAQDEQKFSPEKFNAELQLFIINEAKLSPQEAAKFFPTYREMQNKQRSLYDRQRNLVTMTPNDEASCLKAIKERDEIELELKRIQQTYHERFLEILPASKVYSVLKAEDKFYRHVFRRFNRNRPQINWPQMPQKHGNQGNHQNNHK
jgi:hypothetical protein